ncbi:endo-1,4-beta-xylanase [Paenibacillus endoradicis]|uniref:endo-1,4-beta-xylanase n=1 Tax=Paenibacillus endoradicis TaxID=2972487 RepID=UPI0021593883|nr:endo-1,4-beta-xylanase [Paenibacillus endoradicis]MCR8659773.1 endo-1,4-beta-xylanase [Paenibacillus endoradicis]
MSKKLLRVISILLTAALLIPTGWLAPVAKAVELTNTTTIYHENFMNGKGIAIQSGGAKLEHVTGKIFPGNDDGAALYVSNRLNNYDAPDFGYTGAGLVNGETYTVTVTVYVDEDVVVPVGAQAFLQTADINYGFLAAANYEAGKAITLTKEFTVDTSKDTKLRIQSNTAGATVPFYVGDVLITQQVDELDSYTISFEDQMLGGFSGRAGTETLTVTNEANHTTDGSYSLKVEGRTSNWHGPSLQIEDFVNEGYEYKISAWVKLIQPSSTQLQLSTQIGNGSSANYVTLAPKTINASDDWVQFEGTYRYSNTSSDYLTIYVESSNNSSASFYIDDISITDSGSGLIEIQDDLTPLKDAYANDFLIGNAISAEDLHGVRLNLLGMHHDVVTAGNAMKPDAMQLTKGNFTFDTANAMVDKVLAEGMQMHGHVLVWHQQSPAWMNTTTDGQNNTIPLSRTEALDNLRTHIQTVMENFGDKVISWDVVNEAMIDNPSNPTDWKNALRKSEWFNAIGSDYVEQAFLAAREVLDDNPEWDIKLYYNDYNEDNQNKAQAIYSMIKELNDNYALTHPGKLLIDGMGMQGHYNVNTNPELVKLSLEKFISLGVEVSITELDIQAGSNYQLSEKQANDQGYLYAQLFNLFKDHKDDIARVTFWGLDDNTSWRASTNPLLFDKNLQAKPAYYAVIDPDTFISEHNPEFSNANQGTAKFATPIIDGTVDGVWNQAAEMQINRYQMAWQGATGVAKALWDNENLYVLIQVSDAQLDKTSSQLHEQDSVEIFLDENNEKTLVYQDDDGQYRINFDNESSFNPASIASGFESATNVSGTNYTVEVKIPLKSITPANNMKLGFDVQINDAKAGARQSVAAWNDTTGTGYMDTSVYGELTLTGKPSGSNNNNNNNVTPPSTGNVEIKDGIVVIKPEITNQSNVVTGIVSTEILKQALELATSGTNGKKPIVIDIPKQIGAQSYNVQLPTQSLKSLETFTLSIKTELATIELPSNMLSNTTVNEEHVSIRVAPASIDHLDEATRALIGSHPVLDLSLIAGNKVIPWNNPNAPVTITIPYSPTVEELSNPDSIVVWYIDNNGNLITIPNGRYDATTKSVVFRTTHFSNYAVAYVVKSFEDLNNVPWAKQAIDAMAARDVIKGTSVNSFSPANSITRADFITLLVRSLELQGNGKNTTMFSDVSANAYYYKELVIAKELSIVSGYGDNTFKPNDHISRQDMIVLASRALTIAGKQIESGGTLDAYSDAESIATYAKDDITKLVKLGIVDGKNGKIAPNDSLTRAEAAVILYRIWNL